MLVKGHKPKSDKDWSWTFFDPIDTQDNVGLYNSLTLDRHNNLHISYYDSNNRDLKYASGTLNEQIWQWKITRVDSDGDVGQFSSMALDNQSDRPRIAYYDETNGDLKYATWNGSNWTVQEVDTYGNVGLYCSLILDKNDNDRPYIVYFDKTNELIKYATVR